MEKCENIVFIWQLLCALITAELILFSISRNLSAVVECFEGTCKSFGKCNRLC